MKQLFLTLPAVLVFAGGAPETDYTAERTMRIVAETTIAMETTEFSMTRDGEPVEARFGGGGASQETRTVVQTFRVLEHDEGAPTRVRRSFETVASATEWERGDNTGESELECPLDGVTLELSLEDGEVEVVEGDEPDEAVLAGHTLTLSLDALLPGDEVAEDDSWELEGEAILRALNLDLEAALFPQPEPEEAEEGGRRGRGRRASGSAAKLLADAEWKAEATLTSTDVEYEGLECIEITLELEGEGELEPAETRFGGRRRRMPAGVRGTGASADNDYSIKIEGRLLFSTAEGRPVLLDLEGSLTKTRVSEFDRGETSMTMRTVEEGSFEHRVLVTVE